MPQTALIERHFTVGEADRGILAGEVAGGTGPFVLGAGPSG